VQDDRTKWEGLAQVTEPAGAVTSEDLHWRKERRCHCRSDCAALSRAAERKTSLMACSREELLLLLLLQCNFAGVELRASEKLSFSTWERTPRERSV
jgi:hypothetical protein